VDVNKKSKTICSHCPVNTVQDVNKKVRQLSLNFTVNTVDVNKKVRQFALNCTVNTVDVNKKSETVCS